MMKYFGIEILDGKIYSDFSLEENESLDSQWFFLTSDVGGIDYEFKGFYFCISIAWFGDLEDIYKPENKFSIRIYEGNRTEGKTYYREYTDSDLQKLKEGMQKAVDFIEMLKEMPEDEILNYPGIPFVLIDDDDDEKDDDTDK